MNTQRANGPLDSSALLAHLRQYLVVINPFGEVRQIESGFSDFAGHPFDELIGTNALDLVAPRQIEEIAAHFVGGGEHLIRGNHDMFVLEVIDSHGDVVSMDCLATRVHRDDEPLWLLALTPHTVRSPEQRLIDDHIAGRSARQIAQRLAELRSITTDEGVWIETFVLDARTDGVFTTVSSGRQDSPFIEAFARVVADPAARWNRPMPSNRECDGLDLLPDELSHVAALHDVGAVTVGIATSTKEPELAIVGFGSHPNAFDGTVGRMELQSLVLLDSALLRERNERLLREAAERDALTGLANRVAFDSSVNDDAHDAVLFIDVDRFKDVNDTYGHAVGDAVLIEIARRMSTVCRPRDLIARIGGDEFAVLLHDVDLETARDVGQRLIACVAEPMPADIGSLQITVSVGLAHDTENLIHAADMAMLRGKRLGRNELVIAAD